jgi:protein-tyrosine phosphatase
VKLPRLWPRRGGDAVATLDTPGATRVLMVCMGNICRSPTAEVVLRHKLRDAGLHRQVAVDSAGMIDHHQGQPPDPRAIRHAAQRGYDLSPLRARMVEPADFGRFDWMLAMDGDNLRWLRRQVPAGASVQVLRLLEHAPQLPTVDVPDPYYGSPEGFERVLDLIEAGCEGFVQRLLAAAPLDPAGPREAQEDG